MRHRSCHCGLLAFSLAELLVLIASVAVVLGVVLPTIAGGRRDANVQVSLNNLITLGAAHAVYAAEWNGRQVSVIPDDISAYGNHPTIAMNQYWSANGEYPPTLYLGWGFDDDWEFFTLWGYSMSYSGNHVTVQPIAFESGQAYFGSFRMMHTRPFHDYLAGRLYDPVFFAPGDTAPYDVAAPAFDLPSEFVQGLDMTQDLGDIPVWASYCLSPAAFFDPDVMRNPIDGGWRDPWSIDDGFQTPGLYQALYPSLKTQMLEHHWIQNAPVDRCNPAFEPGSYAGCEPYYFNHGVASEPATLFYDMSVRLLPNAEVLAADAQVMDETGYGLWSRDTPFGENGYLNQYGYDAIQVSHHVLTTDGILGRDTVADASGLAKGARGSGATSGDGPGHRRGPAPPARRPVRRGGSGAEGPGHETVRVRIDPLWP